MQLLTTISDMQSWAQSVRACGERIAFVPTMGGLHEGHCALLRAGRRLGDQLVLSIFVNPTQFGPNEDFGRYPRTFEADLAHACECGVDVVFHPGVTEMYPEGSTTLICVGEMENKLCGAFRPGHFRGVATVVAKLFQIVQPHIALFGEKDYQQLQVICRMVADLDMPVKIKGCPTVREPDGLALSSRNSYLSPEERRRAIAIFRALHTVQAEVSADHHDPALLTKMATEIIASATDCIDYVRLCDATTLEPLTAWKTPAVLAIAAWIGKTRLIDNVIFR